MMWCSGIHHKKKTRSEKPHSHKVSSKVITTRNRGKNIVSFAQDLKHFAYGRAHTFVVPVKIYTRLKCERVKKGLKSNENSLAVLKYVFCGIMCRGIDYDFFYCQRLGNDKKTKQTELVINVNFCARIL